MSVPASYSELELAEFMASALGDIGSVLGWDAFDDWREPVNNTLIAYGVDDIAQATNIAKLRALARVEAWRAAVASLPARYDFSNPEGRYNRSQMLAGARQALSDAEAAAAAYGSTTAPHVVIGEVRRTVDPYGTRVSS